MKTVVALRSSKGDVEKARQRLAQAGADEVVTTLSRAMEKLGEAR